MQTITRHFGKLPGYPLAWLMLGGLWLAQMFWSTPVWAGKTKTEPPRTPVKTQSKVFAKGPGPRASAPERKGKKGVATVPETVQPAKKTNKATPLATARPPIGKNGKLKTPALATRANEKSSQVKASAKLSSKNGKPNQVRLVEQPLNSRLVRATFAPLTPVKLQTDTERRGKFGKPESSAMLAENRRTNRNEEKAVVPAPPLRRNEPAKLSDEERNPERSEALPLTRPREVNTTNDAPAYQIQLPDKIEVVEYGSTSPTIAKLLALPEARPQTPFGAVVTKTNTPPNKRNDLVIPQERVLEIQYELVKRGFYAGEPTGVYDDATVLAMWEFQKNYGLPATGYPSAHALKRLGLTSW